MIFSYVSDFPIFLWFLSHFPVETAISKAHAGDSTASTPVPSDGRGSLAELPMEVLLFPMEDVRFHGKHIRITSTSYQYLFLYIYIVMH